MMRILAAAVLAAVLAGCDGGNAYEPARALVEFARQPAVTLAYFEP
jgi:hypothetical protein